MYSYSSVAVTRDDWRIVTFFITSCPTNAVNDANSTMFTPHTHGYVISLYYFQMLLLLLKPTWVLRGMNFHWIQGAIIRISLKQSFSSVIFQMLIKSSRGLSDFNKNKMREMQLTLAWLLLSHLYMTSSHTPHPHTCQEKVFIGLSSQKNSWLLQARSSSNSFGKLAVHRVLKLIYILMK